MLRRSLIWVLMGLFVAGCGGGGSDSGGGSDGGTANPDADEVILVLGDSIGFGIGTTETFATMMQGLTGIPVVNRSSPGISAEEGASVVRQLINQHNPKWLVVLLGTNNATGAGGGRDGAISSLQFIADVAAQEGVIAVIGTLPPITRNSDENFNSGVISDGIRGISNARIAENRARMNGSHISADGLHPHIGGHQIMAVAFSEQIF